MNLSTQLSPEGVWGRKQADLAHDCSAGSPRALRSSLFDDDAGDLGEVQAKCRGGRWSVGWGRDFGLPLGEGGLLAGCLRTKEGVCGKEVRRHESEQGERAGNGGGGQT